MWKGIVRLGWERIGREAPGLTDGSGVHCDASAQCRRSGGGADEYQHGGAERQSAVGAGAQDAAAAGHVRGGGGPAARAGGGRGERARHPHCGRVARGVAGPHGARRARGKHRRGV